MSKLNLARAVAIFPQPLIRSWTRTVSHLIRQSVVVILVEVSIENSNEDNVIRVDLGFNVDQSLVVEFLRIIGVGHSSGDKQSHDISGGKAQFQDFLHGPEMASGRQKVVDDGDAIGGLGQSTIRPACRVR